MRKIIFLPILLMSFIALTLNSCSGDSENGEKSGESDVLTTESLIEEAN